MLERLNALLEPGGVLTVTERGVIDGRVPSITPHPDFRSITQCARSRHTSSQKRHEPYCLDGTVYEFVITSLLQVDTDDGP